MHGKLHYSIKTYYNVEMSTDINKDLLKQKKKINLESILL